jgi:tetratricopeptide (TPR) repeat protein
LKPATVAKPAITAPAKPVSIFTPGADGFDDTKPAAPPSPTESGKTSKDDDLPTGVDPDLPVPSARPSSDVAAAEPAPEDSSEPVKKTGIAGQLDAGQKALLNGDYKEAMTAFRNALDFDRKSVLAMHGIGITHYQMGEQRKAIEQLEKTLTVGTNRALVHNLAVVHFKENPMRAAKFVRDYLARPNTPLDEPLQNVLGAALNAAGATDAKTGTVFIALREFYFQYDRQLASARTDGMKRWGMNWIPGPQADAKWQVSQSRIQEAEKLDKEVGRAAIRTKKAQDKLSDLNRSFGLIPERKYREANAGIKQAAAEEAETRKRYAAAKQALGTTELPVFPRYIQIIPIDVLTPDKHPKQQ